MRKIKERKRRKLLEKAVATITNRRAKSAEPVEPKPEPKSGDLSHRKAVSRQAVRYNPMTAPNSKLTDTRGVPYEIGPKGQLTRVRPKLQRTMREIRQKLNETPTGKRKKGKGTDGEKV